LYCWGDDHDGEVGDGPGNPEVVAAPVRVGTFEDWAKVSAGREHTCGVRENGKLYCWGLDEDGQVGDGVVNDFRVLAPRRIGTFEDWATVGAGDNHTCGVRRNGKLYCWGSNTQGKIGVGSDDFDPVLAPVRVGTFEDWASVSGGGGHTCGVRRNGKLYCWGYDGTGQLGDGDGSAPHNAPVRIGAFEDWATVSAGREHTCGVRRNGKLYCWGLDDFGRVGDGDGDAPHNAPVRIGAFEDWADGSAGSYHSCGVRKIGKLYCWGDDEFGQVGDGADEVADLAPRRI
jgi:alpha-tubulin suppressor-like RCC1 family protein